MANNWNMIRDEFDKVKHSAYDKISQSPHAR